MTNRGNEQKSLYICTNCRECFYYIDLEGESGICRNCLHNSLKIQEKRTIMVCPTCHRYYDSLDIANLEIPREKRPLFELGKLICNRDKTPLQIRNLTEDITELSEEIFSRFKTEKESEISTEREFLEKLQKLRAEEKAMQEAEDLQ